MFSDFFLGMQQDLKIFLLPPLICAMFRLIFILVYRPKKSPRGEWGKWLTCFRYGFWWGMDFNAYVFLVPLLLVSVPGAFIPAYFAIGDTVRLTLFLLYAALLYTAFIGKMIFFSHFHDTFNQTIWLGRHADKRNFADIFFHQNHGVWLLLGYLPYLALCFLAGNAVLSLPSLSYSTVTDGAGQYAVNALVFVLSIVLFYWLRYGGTLRHRLKPEWDEVPAIVKEDFILGKATMDDLIALKMVWKRPVQEILHHSDEESHMIMRAVLPAKCSLDRTPLEAFKRTARGARITKPRHSFFLLGESYGQVFFDAPYAALNLMEAGARFRAEPHTVCINNFLPSGMISQPSLVSLLLGVYDADLELNENVLFWNHTLPTSLLYQLRALGYRTSFWYGGGLNWGSLVHFIPALGFDAAYGGTDICGADAPRTWLGVYDHIFLAEAARRIRDEGDATPSFHFLYTTSNHGPFLIPLEECGFDAARLNPEMAAALTKNSKKYRGLGCAWYGDFALCRFIDEMRAAFPDSLFIVTGDHVGGENPIIEGLSERQELLLRERILPSFSMHHPALTAEHLAHNEIGGHMNILPTLIELIAPKGFPYYAIEKPLTEPIERVVTPYAWITREEIGFYRERAAQELTVTAGELPWLYDTERFTAERDAYIELTAYYVRHPELLMKSLR